MALTKYELEETITDLTVVPVHHNILVLVPIVEDETDSGIIKGEVLLQDEAEELMKDAFLHVIAVAEDVTTLAVGDRVFCQGTIITFKPDVLPEELNVAPEGYTIGTVLDMYVKLKI